MSFHQRRRVIYATRKGQQDSKIKPVIRSPSTDRLLVEDVLGASLYKRLKSMLEKDRRLSPDMKLLALLGVLKRKQELDTGRTLTDVAAEEAEKAIRRTT